MLLRGFCAAHSLCQVAAHVRALPPVPAGTALVEGLDITRDMPDIYSIMGVCPQHDLLWDQLTGREHLTFYGQLKNLKVSSGSSSRGQWPAPACLQRAVAGADHQLQLPDHDVPAPPCAAESVAGAGHQLQSPDRNRAWSLLPQGQELLDAVDSSLRSVNLFANGVGNRQVRRYSGGMKRRLSVAISFIGGPPVVYLDEPSSVRELRPASVSAGQGPLQLVRAEATAPLAASRRCAETSPPTAQGLDPASRQNLWDVVKQAKEDRGIILTTHRCGPAPRRCSPAKRPASLTP